MFYHDLAKKLQSLMKTGDGDFPVQSRLEMMEMVSDADNFGVLKEMTIRFHHPHLEPLLIRRQDCLSLLVHGQNSVLRRRWDKVGQERSRRHCGGATPSDEVCFGERDHVRIDQ